MATWQPPQSAPRPLRVGDLRAVRIATAIAGLLLVGGMMVRGSLGLSRETPERIVRTDPVTGVVVDDGAGLAAGVDRPLFDGVTLAPGEAATACVRIDYRGDVDPDAVALQLADLNGSDQLARRLSVRVERGQLPPGSTGCDGFVAEGDTGAADPLSLARAARSGTSEGWSPAWDPAPGDESTWYRFSVELDASVDNDLQGSRVGTGFVWSALAAGDANSWLRQIALLLGAVARDTVVPSLLLLAVTVIFLGIQDRIDRRDPKLALAPVTEEPVTFGDPIRIAAAPVFTVPTRQEIEALSRAYRRGDR